MNGTLDTVCFVGFHMLYVTIICIIFSLVRFNTENLTHIEENAPDRQVIGENAVLSLFTKASKSLLQPHRHSEWKSFVFIVEL